jgi:hypothetical protein
VSLSPKPTQLPDRALRDADEDDESGICTRPRRLLAEMCMSRSDSVPARVPAAPTLCGRAARIEQKVRIARLLLDYLPADDAHARLLRVAVIRRDEVLLDGVLTELQRRDLTPA